jgi:protein-S-isoprenylcysteine O-methyltransferase Ste14
VEAVIRSRWFRFSDAATATCREPNLDYAAPDRGTGNWGTKNGLFHPIFNYVGVALTFMLTGLIFGTSIFSGTRLNPYDHFYVPIVLLIVYYTVVGMATDRQVYEKRTDVQALSKALPKYVFWGAAIYGLHWFYEVHPAYSLMTPHTRVFVWHFFWGYVFGGLPYFFLEEKFRYSRENVLADPYVRVVVLLKRLLEGNFGGFRRFLFSRRNRRTLLTWMIRIHYIPVMVEQVHYGMNMLDWTDLWYDGRLAQITFVIGTLAWLIDSNNASIGYFWQSAFTKTRFRDADPHPSHWVIVLACYTPFINFVHDNFVKFPSMAEDSRRLFASPTVNTAIDLTILLALVCYMLSGTALGFSYSNLSYKKIQTRGPYSLVRHPATACKILYFSLVFFRYWGAFDFRWMVCWGIWMSVYIGRALTEERFLKRFGEYREYMKKTRYRFFPGIA